MTQTTIKWHATVVDRKQVAIWFQDSKKRTWNIVYVTRFGFLPFVVSRLEKKAAKEANQIVLNEGI